ncbi:serine hydrolase domain-containing protein [uncultured Paludibaculum sp.]|uniref:serine hydrolase domain-containing protein n=1 Tax=uncultured Paludibaculum sp. TaxID=1765020 RepID=UPI002AAB9C02|nr:serine hydrolase domain-containing protein [uncultured Paludibaculum sp.]
MLSRYCAGLLFVTSLVFAAPPAADAGKAGLDATEVAKIAPRMKAMADDQMVAGTVTLVMHKGTLAHLEATGWADIEARKPMRTDSIVQIMSMTKQFTGAAIMMLVEEGKVRLSDPVEKHLPEFRGQWVIVSQNDGLRTMKHPARPITVRDLMTHTSGMGPAAPGIGDILEKMDRTLAEACLVYSQQPLDFEPGTKWQYSNTGLATLGRIVEVASGMAFEKFLETRIFQPLGMVDSYIFLPAEKHGRLAALYQRKDGKLVKAGANVLAGDALQFRKGAKYSGPEYGIYSTAWDLAQWYQMMLNKGTLNGKKLLSPSSVEVMTRVHTGDLKAGHDPGVGFGLTWAVVKEPIGTLTGHSIGTFDHGGAFGTYGWVDPTKELVGVFLVQEADDAKPVRDAFINMANAAVLEPSR